VSSRDRSISILELLSTEASGFPINVVAKTLAMPLGATHRCLADLKERGYVEQSRDGGLYRLTPKIVTIGSRFLAVNGVGDVAQPVLDALANATGELVRLAIATDRTLTFVAKAQPTGPRASPLRYDPDDGAEVYLPAAASGHAWLSTMGEKEAEAILAEYVERSGHYGPNAPASLVEVSVYIAGARSNGFAAVNETYELGTSAVAVPVMHWSDDRAVGTLSIAGPSVRLNERAIREAVPLLQAAGEELKWLCGRSRLFDRTVP